MATMEIAEVIRATRSAGPPGCNGETKIQQLLGRPEWQGWRRKGGRYRRRQYPRDRSNGLVFENTRKLFSYRRRPNFLFDQIKKRWLFFFRNNRRVGNHIDNYKPIRPFVLSAHSSGGRRTERCNNMEK